MPSRAVQYVALLRGINVGGKNLIPMTALRAAFEGDGHGCVRTYIQSGNVLFTSDAPAAGLEARIEAVLEAEFQIPLVVVVQSQRQLQRVVRKAPDGFGAQPDTYHSDVVFLKAPLTAAKVMDILKLREGVDSAWGANGVVYFQRLSAQRTKSRMSAIASTPEYKLMTIRSWSTTTKLLHLMEDGAAG